MQLDGSLKDLLKSSMHLSHPSLAVNPANFQMLSLPRTAWRWTPTTRVQLPQPFLRLQQHRQTALIRGSRPLHRLFQIRQQPTQTTVLKMVLTAATVYHFSFQAPSLQGLGLGPVSLCSPTSRALLLLWPLKCFHGSQRRVPGAVAFH